MPRGRSPAFSTTPSCASAGMILSRVAPAAAVCTERLNYSTRRLRVSILSIRFPPRGPDTVLLIQHVPLFLISLCLRVSVLPIHLPFRFGLESPSRLSIPGHKVLFATRVMLDAGLVGRPHVSCWSLVLLQYTSHITTSNRNR
jgi:hypothetical protein